ncbi:protein translocase subunit SecF [Sulfurovum sp. bin170]|uniref:protein translocase subunit SecF n=1 Tax=Sulfurovum sp. bin170 TaxID=2695268 RepID=UPI0013DEB80F|nr:protein translocase subunit SecF [Sulfurovum sp. bin170]NEW60194.1 protein translocase subunit SecF [Sulfurovum sp. bin170]
MEVFKYNRPVVRFMTNAKKFGIFSIVLVVLSLGFLATKGLNYGIDFAGGTLIQVQYEKDAPIQEVRDRLSKVESYKGANVTFFGSDTEIVIRTKNSSKKVDVDTGDEIRKILDGSGAFEIRRVDMVGPAVGDELKTKGLMAMFWAIIGILAYISFRFEWRFAIASVVALTHDIIIAMGALALFQIDVNLPILAALLTILGYSLNDTVIVFDRIREGIRTIKSPDLADVIDESVTRTLSRTTLTSLTTFFVVLTLYIFGGEIISGFSFTLLVGVVVGTYSSIFVASPILMWLKFSILQFREREAAGLKREKEKEKMRAQFEQGTM